jgi:hypothetical protein
MTAAVFMLLAFIHAPNGGSISMTELGAFPDKAACEAARDKMKAAQAGAGEPADIICLPSDLLKPFTGAV